MATSTKPTTPSTTAPAGPKVRKTPPTLVERTKAQWSTAALRAKVTVEDIDLMSGHLNKLKSLLS